MHDLKLLSPHGYEAVSSMATGRKLREQRLEELKRNHGTLPEGYLRILEDLKQTRDRRHILKEYYLKVKDILQETRAISRQEKDDFLTGAKECIEDLKNKRYTVLIAGETSAGKSSLINLLLNDHVLPTNIMQNTLTICEISYGARKEAVVHFSKQSKPPKILRRASLTRLKSTLKSLQGMSTGARE
ncbi:hypothetical protein OS493_010420 [Desmophyllum pertusum]|uniref:Dynamin N-terminal domain-containing protein n=1 Tax=Desmophyllum pertusum TaxID=174260 RepID=A0A9X0A496_9CNID|nr:hypothetical protein OS493_010420 [Desmophyllum pertusum]